MWYFIYNHFKYFYNYVLTQSLKKNENNIK